MGGGNVLGKAIQSSGLLGYLSDAITFGNISSPLLLVDSEFCNIYYIFVLALPLSNPWLAFVFILLFSGSVANFISHTVASLILMPIIVNIGITLGIPKMMVIGTAFSGKKSTSVPHFLVVH